MDTWDQLLEAYKIGLREGEAALSPDVRAILDRVFLVEFEQGGWLYNWSTSPETFDATVLALQRRGLHPLAEILSRVRSLLEPVNRHPEMVDRTWSKTLKVIDPENELKDLERQITALPNYRLPEHWCVSASM